MRLDDMLWFVKHCIKKDKSPSQFTGYTSAAKKDRDLIDLLYKKLHSERSTETSR